MQARTAAALLHPHRAAWKPLMRANLQRALPGLGEAVLVQQSKQPWTHARAVGQLGERHAAYIEALQRVGIMHRQVEHQHMSREQIKLEPLLGNHSVGSATDGTMLTAAGSIPAHLRQGLGTTVGQVLPALTMQPAVDQIVLPAAWRQTLQQQGSSNAWDVDQGQRWVRQRLAGGVDRFYVVKQDGSMRALEATPAAQWVPCCVVDVTVVGQAQVLEQQQSQQQQSQQQQPQPGEWDQQQRRQRRGRRHRRQRSPTPMTWEEWEAEQDALQSYGLDPDGAEQPDPQRASQVPRTAPGDRAAAPNRVSSTPPGPNPPQLQQSSTMPPLLRESQRSQHSQQQPPAQQAKSSLYLVGAWDSIKVDPSIWCFGCSIFF
jgi:hypothetical protein